MMRFLRAAAFMSPFDIGLFLRSSRTDKAIAQARANADDETAFDVVYSATDPWASIDKRYRYQRRKYETLYALLPSDQKFGRVLDIGAGLGSMSRLLAGRSDAVVGLDISEKAVAAARKLHSDVGNLRFEQGDVRALKPDFDGLFDLVILADVIYYLPRPITDAALKSIALQISALLSPGGVCLLANHFFFSADPDSRLSRRIHQAFAWSPGFEVISQHRRPFYLASLLKTVGESGQRC